MTPRKDTGGSWVISAHPCCSAHAKDGMDAPCCQVRAWMWSLLKHIARSQCIQGCWPVPSRLSAEPYQIGPKPSDTTHTTDNAMRCSAWRCDIACWPVQAVAELRTRPSGWFGVALPPRITETREYQIVHRLHTFPVAAAAAVIPASRAFPTCKGPLPLIYMQAKGQLGRSVQLTLFALCASCRERARAPTGHMSRHAGGGIPVGQRRRHLNRCECVTARCLRPTACFGVGRLPVLACSWRARSCTRSAWARSAR